MKPAPVSIISRRACLKRGCCWDRRHHNKNLWCYENPCECVNCRFTVDNQVNYVKYNGNALTFTGTNNLYEEKLFSFESCSDKVPGELEIRGTDVNPSNHCKWGGLLLHCTASRTTSPWHNFVSDNTHWTVSSEGNTTPCQQEDFFAKYFEPYCYPSGTCLAPNSYHFISSLNTAGAKKIWGQQKTVTLKGSPWADEKQWQDDLKSKLTIIYFMDIFEEIRVNRNIISWYGTKLSNLILKCIRFRIITFVNFWDSIHWRFCILIF